MIEKDGIALDRSVRHALALADDEYSSRVIDSAGHLTDDDDALPRGQRGRVHLHSGPRQYGRTRQRPGPRRAVGRPDGDRPARGGPNHAVLKRERFGALGSRKGDLAVHRTYHQGSQRAAGPLVQAEADAEPGAGRQPVSCRPQVPRGRHAPAQPCCRAPPARTGLRARAPSHARRSLNSVGTPTEATSLA